MSSSRCLLSILSKCNRDKASAAMCFSPGWCKTSMLNFIRFNPHLASRPVESFKSSIQRRAWCSVRTTSLRPVMYDRGMKTALTTARNFCCVVSYFFTSSFNVFDHYAIDLRSFSSCCGGRKTQPNCLSHAAAPIVSRASSLGNVSIRGLIFYSFTRPLRPFLLYPSEVLSVTRFSTTFSRGRSSGKIRYKFAIYVAKTENAGPQSRFWDALMRE